MSKFSKGKKRREPAISTAALPDIVFMLLFFFMVTAKFKNKEEKVVIQIPNATESTIFEKNTTTFYYWIGKPKDQAAGKDYRLQMDDAIVSNLGEVRQFLLSKRLNEPFTEIWLTEDLINYMSIDEDAPMVLVRGVQEELRESDALTVQYSVKDKN
jgi:biopolymer transport protein ExbD